MEPRTEPKTSQAPPEADRSTHPEPAGPAPLSEVASVEPVTPPPVEIRIEGRGGTWWARVVGSSGRTRARSAPLLLLGFRPEGADSPTIEALVAGRSLEEVPDEVLRAALTRAAERPPASKRAPFFEEADGARGT